jgi:branched-chain amino acid transport system substrate-binding protein
MPSNSFYTRRSFLRLAGLTMGALTAPSVCGKTARAAAPLHIGIIVPEPSARYHFASELQRGLALYLTEQGGTLAGQEVQLHIEHYQRSTSRGRDMAAQLLNRQPIDLLVALINRGVLGPLRPQLHERQLPLLIADAGADVWRSAQDSPYILRNSLSYWQSNWALGRWAGAEIGQRAFIATSFYESGYDALYAFRAGLSAAGATSDELVVTHRPDQEADFDALMRKITLARPDFVYAAYSGPQATAFLQAYAAAGLAGRTPLLGGAALVDELQPAAHGAYTALPWSAALTTDANQDFVRRYVAQYGQMPLAGAALGFDTAALIGHALDASGGRTGSALRDALAAQSYLGVRGPVAFLAGAQEITAPIYLRQFDAGSSTQRVIARLATDGVAALAADLSTSLKTGWTNAYLAI